MAPATHQPAPGDTEGNASRQLAVVVVFGRRVAPALWRLAFEALASWRWPIVKAPPKKYLKRGSGVSLWIVNSGFAPMWSLSLVLIWGPLYVAANTDIAFGRRQGEKSLLADSATTTSPKHSASAAPNSDYCDRSCTFDANSTGELKRQKLVFSQAYTTVGMGDLNLSVPKPMYSKDWELSPLIPNACCPYVPPSLGDDRDTRDRGRRLALVTMADDGYVLPLVAMLQSFSSTNPWFGAGAEGGHDVIIPYSIAHPGSPPIISLSEKSRLLLHALFKGRLRLVFKPGKQYIRTLYGMQCEYWCVLHLPRSPILLLLTSIVYCMRVTCHDMLYPTNIQRSTIPPYRHTTIQPYNHTTIQPYNHTTHSPMEPIHPCNPSSNHAPTTLQPLHHTTPPPSTAPPHPTAPHPTPCSGRWCVPYPARHAQARQVIQRLLSVDSGHW
jgi:hypothetical protein